jgi:hypothetical protein
VVAAVGLIVAAASSASAASTTWYGDGCINYHEWSAIGNLDDRNSTCSGADDYYAGKLRDSTVADGLVANVYMDGILMASTGNTTTGVNFTFHDPQSNSSAWTCLQDASGDTYCATNVSF